MEDSWSGGRLIEDKEGQPRIVQHILKTARRAPWNTRLSPPSDGSAGIAGRWARCHPSVDGLGRWHSPAHVPTQFRGSLPAPADFTYITHTKKNVICMCVYTCMYVCVHTYNVGEGHGQGITLLSNLSFANFLLIGSNTNWVETFLLPTVDLETLERLHNSRNRGSPACLFRYWLWPWYR